MIKKTIIAMMFVLVAQFLVAETQVLPIEGLSKPGMALYMDKDRMYVVENFSILIYSKKDFKLIKKFGQKGQGPQEFVVNPEAGLLAQLSLDVETDKLVIRSLGKVSWFSKDGLFLTEKKLPSPFLLTMSPLGKNYISMKSLSGKVQYVTLVVLNDTFKEIKELNRIEDPFQQGKGLKMLNVNPVHICYKDKLFMAWDNDLKIKVLDTNLNELYTINYPMKRKVVTNDEKAKIIEFLRTGPETKQYFQYIQPITFPEYYPAILGISIANDKIYVNTFFTEKVSEDVQNYETLIFDLKGKFLKRVMAPLRMQDPILPYPNTIYDGKFYQLIENLDDEGWEVHITNIE